MFLTGVRGLAVAVLMLAGTTAAAEPAHPWSKQGLRRAREACMGVHDDVRCSDPSGRDPYCHLSSAQVHKACDCFVKRLQGMLSEADLAEKDRRDSVMLIQLTIGQCRYQVARPAFSTRKLSPEHRERFASQCRRDGTIPAMCACMLKAWGQRYTRAEVEALAFSTREPGTTEQNRVLLWCSENRDGR